MSALFEDHTLSWIFALGGWLIIGGGVAIGLRRSGEPSGTVLAAVPAWPLFLPLLHPSSAPHSYRSRIERTRS